MKRVLGIALGFVVAACLTAGAGIIVDDTFDGSGNLDGWAIDSSPVPGSPYGTLGNTGASDGPSMSGGSPGFLQTSAGPGVGGLEEDRIYDSAGEFDGNWAQGGIAGANGIGAIGFDFYTDAVSGGPPDILSVYLVASGTTWFYDITGLPGSGWAQYFAYVGSPAGWYNMVAAPSSQFATDLTGVTEFGFLLTYQGDVGLSELYGFDNIRILEAIPEPQTYAMLGFALLSLGVTFRRRLNDTVSKLMKR